MKCFFLIIINFYKAEHKIASLYKLTRKAMRRLIDKE